MLRLKLTLLLLVTLLFTSNANAETINGRVTRVIDGDTVIFLPNQGQKFKVRLNGIDVSEKIQPFSKASKKSLTRLCAKAPARLRQMRRIGTVEALAAPYCN